MEAAERLAAQHLVELAFFFGLELLDGHGKLHAKLTGRINQQREQLFPPGAENSSGAAVRFRPHSLCGSAAAARRARALCCASNRSARFAPCG
jgi:hypothetical protein